MPGGEGIHIYIYIHIHVKIIHNEKHTYIYVYMYIYILTIYKYIEVYTSYVGIQGRLAIIWPAHLTLRCQQISARQVAVKDSLMEKTSVKGSQPPASIGLFSRAAGGVLQMEITVIVFVAYKHMTVPIVMHVNIN